jgi:hypothetical protein
VADTGASGDEVPGGNVLSGAAVGGAVKIPGAAGVETFGEKLDDTPPAGTGEKTGAPTGRGGITGVAVGGG